jgi:hypothetical protein
MIQYAAPLVFWRNIAGYWMPRFRGGMTAEAVTPR